MKTAKASLAYQNLITKNKEVKLLKMKVKHFMTLLVQNRPRLFDTVVRSCQERLGLSDVEMLGDEVDEKLRIRLLKRLGTLRNLSNDGMQTLIKDFIQSIINLYRASKICAEYRVTIMVHLVKTGDVEHKSMSELEDDSVRGLNDDLDGIEAVEYLIDEIKTFKDFIGDTSEEMEDEDDAEDDDEEEEETKEGEKEDSSPTKKRKCEGK